MSSGTIDPPLQCPARFKIRRYSLLYACQETTHGPYSRRETVPRLGEYLGNRSGLDLTGYYKLYAAKKSIRIVYRIIDQKILVEVVAIGRQEDLAVYQEAINRLNHRKR